MTLAVSAGSVRVDAAVAFEDGDAAESGKSALLAATPTSLSDSLGITVESVVAVPTVAEETPPPCRAGLGGPYCGLCLEEDQYYVKAAGEAPAECRACTGSLGPSLLTFIGGPLIALLVLALLIKYVKLPKGVVSSVGKWNRELTPLNKVRHALRSSPPVAL